MPSEKCSLTAHVSASTSTSSSSNVEGWQHGQHQYKVSHAAAASDNVVATFLATQPLLEDEDASAAAAADGVWGGAEVQGCWLGEHDGYDDDGNDGIGDGHMDQEQQPKQPNQHHTGHELLGLGQGDSEVGEESGTAGDNHQLHHMCVNEAAAGAMLTDHLEVTGN